MQLWIRKGGKRKVQIVKSDGRAKNKRVEKLGTISIQGKDQFVYLNFHRFYYFLRGGAKYHFSQIGKSQVDFFFPLYVYEKSKRSG